MPLWRAKGLLAFTINLQGGSPQGYSRSQPWINSAFETDASAAAPGASKADYFLGSRLVFSETGPAASEATTALQRSDRVRATLIAILPAVWPSPRHPPRRLRSHHADRRRRHGRGLSCPRHETESRRGEHACGEHLILPSRADPASCLRLRGVLHSVAPARHRACGRRRDWPRNQVP
jgi:hypothetical protein